MTGKTHIQFAVCCLCAANTIKPITSWEDAIVYLMIGSVSSTFPDLDSEASWASRSIYGFDDVLRKFKILKHRGISHFTFKPHIKGILKFYTKYIGKKKDFSSYCIELLILYLVPCR